MLRKSLIGLGFFVALIPYLGLPQSTDTVLSTFAGTAIVILLLVARPERRDRQAPGTGETSRESEQRPEDRKERNISPRPHGDRSEQLARAKELRVVRTESAAEDRPLGRSGAPLTRERREAAPSAPLNASVPIPHETSRMSSPSLPKREPRIRPSREKRIAASMSPITRGASVVTQIDAPMVGIIPAQEEHAPVLAEKQEVRRRRKKTSDAEVASLTS